MGHWDEKTKLCKTNEFFLSQTKKLTYFDQWKIMGYLKK